MADTIEGNAIDLSDGRQVFLGKDGDSYCIWFVAKEGHKTFLRLSPEALDALVQLAPPPVERFILKVKNLTKGVFEKVIFEWTEVQDADVAQAE